MFRPILDYMGQKEFSDELITVQQFRPVIKPAHQYDSSAPSEPVHATCHKDHKLYIYNKQSETNQQCSYCGY
jgi:hypothetical protein